MNNTSGLQEVRASIFRLPSSRFLKDQRHQFGTGSWQFLDIHDFIALSTGISPKRKEVPDTIFKSRKENMKKPVLRLILLMALVIFFPYTQRYLFAADSTPPGIPSGLNVGGGGVCPEAKALSLPLEKQQTSTWCWATTAKIAMHYKGDQEAQCFIVDAVRQNQLNIKSPPTCCISQPQTVLNCMVTSESWRALKEFNFKYDTKDESGFAWPDLRTQICGDGPVLYGEDYWDGGGHEYILRGFRRANDGHRWVILYDPTDDPTNNYTEKSYDDWLRLSTTGPDPDRSNVEYYINIHK